MTWNFNMDEAPKGQFVDRTRTLKTGEVVQYQTFELTKILAAYAKSDLVTMSNWIPSAKRWNMFTEQNPPVAWMPWPAHPGSKP